MTSTDPDTLDAVTHAIHEHVKATAELPVDPTASTYLGEAEAVAADAVAALRAGQETAAITRLEQVQTLLSHIDTTGNPRADEHLEEAARLAGIAPDERDDVVDE